MSFDAPTSLADFIRANTRATGTEGLPVRLYLADRLTPLWEATGRDLAAAGIEPPFWAFAWAGGQAVSRYILAHPETVRGRRVLDLAAGSGLVAIAAALAGAAHVEANDIDPVCEVAIRLNADLNGVTVGWRGGDLLDTTPTGFDVILAGDVFYEQHMSRRFLEFLMRAHTTGADILAGDPGRTYFPHEAFEEVATYGIIPEREIESADVTRTRVWRLGSVRKA